MTMPNRIRRLGNLAMMTLVALLPFSAAADGQVIPMSAENSKDMKLFGEGVVGKAVAAKPLTDLAHAAAVGEGTWEFKIVAGDDEGKSTTEIFKKTKDGHWQRSLGKNMIEYMKLSADAWSKFAETDLDFEYRSDFDPPVHHAGAWKPGDSTTIESDIKVTKVGEPDDVKYSGHMKATVSYEGAYEITTPAGKFEAALMKGVYDIKVGPADVKDVQYLFYAPGVGKVAEIEALSVSALLIYHSHDKTAKVLTKHPGSSK
jgi:hypothetical protein